MTNIILPFNYKINEKCCKGIVFNHGLYTQCTKQSKNKLCKVCEKEKYGSIEKRILSPKGTFISNEGKNEVPYDKFIKKMNYNIEDVIRELKNNNIDYDLNHLLYENEKKNKGRPKKNKEENSIIINNPISNLHIPDTLNNNKTTTNSLTSNNIENDDDIFEEIEVIRIKLNDKFYLKTKENVLLDEKTYDIIGILNNNNIDTISI